MHLVVTNPFGGRQIGDVIVGDEAMAKILAGENAHHVMRVAPVQESGPHAQAEMGFSEPQKPADA